MLEKEEFEAIKASAEKQLTTSIKLKIETAIECLKELI